ncbi:MAG: helix-turn-helix transcriptional regulator [Bacteroidales bacterium]|nr:helix-turn-helix transcriptional regulator [Bacteroidales bacterium]
MKKSTLTETVKRLRKQYGLTQTQLALKSGVGLNFIREMEQGKATVRLDKVNQVLLLFNYEMAPMPRKDEQ